MDHLGERWVADSVVGDQMNERAHVLGISDPSVRTLWVTVDDAFRHVCHVCQLFVEDRHDVRFAQCLCLDVAINNHERGDNPGNSVITV